MIFVIKSSSNPYWSFKNNIKSIIIINLNNEFYIYIYLLRIDVFYFNQFLHNLSNLILIRFTGIEVNYLYIYQKNWFKKLVIRIVFYNS
jgi:hypothetical protein